LIRTTTTSRSPTATSATSIATVVQGGRGPAISRSPAAAAAEAASAATPSSTTKPTSSRSRWSVLSFASATAKRLRRPHDNDRWLAYDETALQRRLSHIHYSLRMALSPLPNVAADVCCFERSQVRPARR